ncbi:STAS domain-containing protein [Algicella marina]|uniref:STAS domain-containing protein n=1 Tax=Algicella marina TaxID=2683284 RepID=A0A6P1SXW8_9RHOB|nr:STAS domain-containing protein [Algicella marina]QHQ35524.1 STAS domain-containing protein [Algicella marina]
MQVQFAQTRDTTIVHIEGPMNLLAAGHLYERLLFALPRGSDNFIVDLAAVPSATRAGLRGIIVAAKLMQRRRGQMLISGANANVTALLRGCGIDNLLKFEPTLDAAAARLCEEASHRHVLLRLSDDRSQGARPQINQPLAAIG